MLDLTPEQRDHAERRLRDEAFIWLTTVREDGQPQTSPVWFVWDGQELLVYSMPASQKVPNVRAHPQVSVNFNGDERGGDVVTIEGEARIDEDAPPVHLLPSYVEKYEARIRRLGTDPEPFGRAYSAAIRIRPTRARVWR